MALIDLLTQRAALHEGAVSATSGTGEETITYATALSDVPVLVQQVTAPVDLRIGLAERVTHRIICLPLVGIDLESGHWQFVIDGKTYVVLSRYDPANRGHHWEIPVRRLQ